MSLSMRVSLLLLAHGTRTVIGFCATASTMQACRTAVERVDANMPLEVSDRVLGYVEALLSYNERTNVYSKSAYDKLPFHVADSLTLALDIRARTPQRGVLDLGSGSGLPSVIIACVNPHLAVFSVESKSRKTRFLTKAGSILGLDHYKALTQNVNELSRSWVFDVDFVTAKAFKPLPEVGPIARRCILQEATLMVPISEAQRHDFALSEAQLTRHGVDHLYYTESIQPSHGAEQRKLLTIESAHASRLR